MRLALTCEAFVISAGLFAWLAGAGIILALATGILGGAGQSPVGANAGGPAAWGATAIGLGPIALVAGMLSGPAAAWFGRGRQVSVLALAGGLAGAVIMPVAAGLCAPLAAAALGLALRPVTDWEYAGALALAVLFAVAVLALVGLALALGHVGPQRRWLPVLRWLAAGGLLVLATTTGWALASGASPELAEAGIFAGWLGMCGGAATLGADLLAAWGTPRASYPSSRVQTP